MNEVFKRKRNITKVRHISIIKEFEGFLFPHVEDVTKVDIDRNFATEFLTAK